MAMEETPICVNQSMTVLVFQLQIPGIVISKIFADEYTVVLQVTIDTTHKNCYFATL